MSKSQSNLRKTMPKWEEVFGFWSNTSISTIKTDFPKLFSENRCFACGIAYPSDVKLERCHIQPLWAGGSNLAENIHLLCHVCHKDSEDFGRPDMDKNHAIYWAWFFSRNRRKRDISSRLRNGDPGTFDGLEGCEIERMVSMLKIVGEAFEYHPRILDKIAISFGFESWYDCETLKERVLFV